MTCCESIGTSTIGSAPLASVCASEVAWANVPTLVISDPLPDGIPFGNCVKSIDATVTIWPSSVTPKCWRLFWDAPGTVLI